MGTGWRALRRRILTPDVSETSLDKRGFHKKSPAAQELLETVGTLFLKGYADAVESRTPEDLAQRLEEIPERFRGFAYEGAGMGYGVLDGLPFGGSKNVDALLAGPGDPHIYMVYVGVGWAMARIPRFRWPAFGHFDPLLSWLVLDGYGFHQAYFQTKKYVHEQYQNENFSWGGKPAYANRCIDQGIGRALWFVGGTDAELVTSLLGRFPAERHGDLYAGVGLAATYAGGGDEDELHLLVERAGEFRGQLAQGSSFAAEARVRAGLVVPHNNVATKILCGLPVERAAQASLDVRPGGDESATAGDLPAFELWRQRIAREVLSLGGVGK
ncbi:DUF1702 family protein [Amycolatopsis sp. H20-H5]|uniref:DUF1702 family protein n=1 Tax=Amycolatopsis sp. H20-H5 TaxID=3046309 RepID=UPI002DBBCDB8|nr:DUF1702 family protein [Amycolatopsis sp. H20-H5]MEC3976926.1 DUF1702 family protein [Amycolatopsis sp. H20-H5]